VLRPPASVHARPNTRTAPTIATLSCRRNSVLSIVPFSGPHSKRRQGDEQTQDDRPQ
jgi:hypothetical protein